MYVYLSLESRDEPKSPEEQIVYDLEINSSLEIAKMIGASLSKLMIEKKKNEKIYPDCENISADFTFTVLFTAFNILTQALIRADAIKNRKEYLENTKENFCKLMDMIGQQAQDECLH